MHRLCFFGNICGNCKENSIDNLSNVSTCLSDVMVDIGVTKEIVELRKKVGIERAALTSLQLILDGDNEIVYNFGSQSEGNY